MNENDDGAYDPQRQRNYQYNYIMVYHLIATFL